MDRKEKYEFPEIGSDDDRYYVHFLNNFGMVDLSIEDVLMPTLTPVEQSLYRRLYRLSFCYRRTWCQVGYQELARACNISSLSTVKRGMQGLQRKHCIKTIATSVQRKPNIYRVYLPAEMPQFRDENMNTGVVLTKHQVDLQELKHLILRQPKFSKLKFSLLKFDTLEELRPPKNAPLTSKISALNFGGLTDKPTDNAGLERQKSNSRTPINNNKIINNNSLSDNVGSIITSFYRKIGQPRISREKRARAKGIIRELQNDGFTLDDIRYAVGWTVRNARRDIYDFAIIRHTIGQALGEREKTEEREQAERMERQKRLELERQEQEREELRAYKASMDESERSALREQALAEIGKMEGIRPEFIGEALIEAKENELLRASMSPGDSEIHPATESLCPNTS